MLNTYNYIKCFRPLLKQIKNSAEAHIILDCNTEKIYEVLKQAQQIGMMSDYHSYLITSLVSLKCITIKSIKTVNCIRPSFNLPNTIITFFFLKNRSIFSLRSYSISRQQTLYYILARGKTF